jgi:ubiquinone/menaquinone biosynthesis C-methylase UbiE
MVWTGGDESATATGYDHWASSYDDEDPSTWLDEPFLLEQLKPFPGCRLLDLGCGTGRYLRQLTPRLSLYRVTAVDLSRGMLARAGQDIDKSIPIQFLQASATCLPFQPCSFDRIMSGLVIDHVASPDQLFREIAAVLGKAGRAVVAGVHPDMQRLTGADIDVAGNEGAVRIPGHIHEVADLVAAAKGAHLTADAIEEPCVTPAMVARRPAWECKLGCPALVLLALVKVDQLPVEHIPIVR